MSRHYFNFSANPSTDSTHKIVVGWNPVLRTFFFQVYKDPNYEAALFWEGESRKEITTVAKLEERLSKTGFGLLPRDLKESLEKEMIEEGYAPPKEPLQRLLDFKKKYGG